MVPIGNYIGLGAKLVQIGTTQAGRTVCVTVRYHVCGSGSTGAITGWNFDEAKSVDGRRASGIAYII